MEQYAERKIVFYGLFITIGLIFILKLANLQIFDSSLKASASDIGRKTLIPSRGLIYDRYGKLIVTNNPTYDIYITLNNTEEMDTAKFCSLLNIPKHVFGKRIKELKAKGRKFSKYKPELFMSQVPAEIFAGFEENLFKFPGFSYNVKAIRGYPYKCAPHLLGEIAEVDPNDLKRSDYYRSGDIAGKSGLEYSYEELLRGKKGKAYFLKDNRNRNIGPFEDGAFDTIPIPGKDLILTIDIELQKYGEWLMEGKRGSIVAIEPGTGEILAIVSSPSYDPSLLVGSGRGKNFEKLRADSANAPLYNRPLFAKYAPGSTFKPVTGLIGLQEGVMETKSGIACRGGGYYISGLHIGCHNHPPINNLNAAIQYSCNAYFCHSFRKLIEADKFADESAALRRWNQHLYDFNLGKKVGLEYSDEYPGLVPTPAFYDKMHNGWRWRASTIISLAIGQGELEVTPLQLANLYAIIANKGYYHQPHIARSIGADTISLQKIYDKTLSSIDHKYFDYIHDGLEAVVTNGTARRARVEGISVCGKTGTAENIHGEDHALFACFAPKNNAAIAIAVVVENSGFGGTWAAPISGLMIEKFLKRDLSDRRKEEAQKIHEARFLYEKEEGINP